MLLVGGFDPSGGAGLLLDCRAARAAGVHPAAVIAVRTIQDGVRFVSSLPENASDVLAAVELMLRRFDFGAVKIGALGTAANVEAVAESLASLKRVPLILDPVLGSTTGGRLLFEDGLEALRARLIPMTTLITPNLEEAGVLTETKVADPDGMRTAAERILGLGARSVLVKGGHLSGEVIEDLYADQSGITRIFRGKRLMVGDVRGTGCGLASIIAALTARGFELLDAVETGRKVLANGIVGAYRIGEGPRMLGELIIDE